MRESPPPLNALLKRAEAALNGQAFGELQRLCKQILSIDKNQADAWFFMSIVAEAGRQPGHAIQFVDRALQVNPAHPEYLSQKARLHSQLNQFPEAKKAADQAIDTRPERAIVLDTLGVVMTRLGYHERAAALLRQAVQKQPDNAQFQFNLGSAEQFLGHDDAARRAYQKAIELNKDFSRAHWALSELEKNQSRPGRLEQLRKLLSDRSMSSEDQLYLAHAVSREYEKNSEYDQAFATLAAGKQRRKTAIRYSIEDDLALFQSIRDRFSTAPPNPADRDALAGRAVFILGMPRSGTTLVERIVSSHSQVTSMGELQDFPRAIKQVAGTGSTLVLDAETVHCAGQAEMTELGHAYATLLAERIPATGRFIDKLPLNFLCVGFIRAALPEARIVCLRRNPLDTCLSNYRQLFALNFSYYNYHYDLTDTARYCVEFERLMTFWKELYGDQVQQLHYEELVLNPEQTTRELLDYLGLAWEPGCLDFHRSSGAVATASASQVRQPIYSSALYRWKHFEKHLAPAMRVFDEAGVSYR